MSEFQVTNQSTGRVFAVRSDETILDSLLRQGVAVPYSCRNGTCAACKASLISGKVVYDEYDPAALSDEEIENGFALLCRAHPTEDLEILADELSMLSSMIIQKLPCRVIEMNHLAHDVMEVKLALPRDTVFHYLAGQYIDIMMRDDKRRGFSIANAPGDNVLTLQVRKVPKGRFTGHIFQSMKIRDILRFEGPLGTFFLRTDSDRPIIFIAGGTGFAPLNAILEDVFRDRKFSRSIHLFWGVRTTRDLYHLELAAKWTKQHEAQFRFTPVLSEPTPEENWRGETGWVHDSVLRHYPDLSNYEVYASGPPPMIEVIRETLPNHGLDSDRLFYDSFEFSSDTLYPAQSND